MITLPTLIAAYVEAANAQDAARVAACFVPDGTVHDEGALLRGTAEIAEWTRETSSRYQAVIAPVGIVEVDGKSRLTATVSGDFPGSPATLAFNFVLRPEGIASLEVTA
jgi:hypothetical protein